MENYSSPSSMSLHPTEPPPLKRSVSDQYLDNPDRLTKKFKGVANVISKKYGNYIMSMKPKKCMESISIQGKWDDVERVHWLFGQKIPKKD